MIWCYFIIILHLITFATAEQPTFTQPYPYFLQVEENSPNGHLIGFVNASVSNQLLQITYKTSVIKNDVIIIDQTTGGLYVNGTIDADIPDVHDIKFTVYAYTDPSQKVSTSVFVIINDVNDNFPVFQNTPYKVNISEDTPINTYVTRVQASDVDRKGLSELIYNIVGWTKNSMFSIKEFAGTIWTNKRLDYEKNVSHILNISVTDGRPKDPNRHIVYTTVEIFVVDFDDQGAKFDKYTYYATVEEGFHNFTNLIQVHATDLDKGINAPVTYSILPASNKEEIYQIDANTGQVKIHGLIDREASGSLFYLTVQAKSTTHEPATATVIISINDTNDNGPLFQKSHFIGSVLENSLVGTKVLLVSAMDYDMGINKELTYSIKGGDEKFRIDSNGNVIVNGSLDREKRHIFHFEVHVVETKTAEKYENSTNVTIYIQDVNDNSPSFEKSVFDVAILEEEKAPVFIVQLNATDKDFGQNSLIDYSIVPDAENRHLHFYIDQSNGSLYTAQKLDRETIAMYSILVKAKDRAPAGQTRESLCTVKVKVLDINDNPPYFTKSNYETSITEAANVNTIVFALQALDADEGINARLQYNLLPGNNSDFFRIDANSGIIKTAKELDRESIQTFDLYAQVKDGGNRSSSVKVAVNVLDINDNSPIFAKKEGYHFNVTEEEVGVFVGQVRASDIDKDDAGKVRYSITNSDKFTIDEVTGRIKTAKALDRETMPVHKITIVARDMSRMGPRNSYAQVEIDILDINDNAPKFVDPKEYSTVMNKDAEIGSFVFRFKANDLDINENGRISYQLAPENQGLFFIDNATGTLRLKTQMPSKVNNSMIVKVMAFDNGVPQANDSAQLLIYFANVFKNAPVIDPPVITTSIKENVKAGALIYDVNAKYDGKVSEETYKYSILHGGEDKFTIHFETGKITTLVPLDRETQAKYTIIIMVQLRAQSEANFATVEVDVEDENDNPPSFSSNSFIASVYENQNPNTTVSKIVAKDSDEGINSEISYYLNGSDHFGVNKASGEIFTMIKLDRENISEYNLTLMAVNDAANDTLHSETEIRIIVLDLNDNAPRFDKLVYNGKVKENAALNTSVMRVTAHDVDEGINGFIKYDIEANDCFFVEWQTGVIRTSCMLDRENVSIYLLRLIAKDLVSPSLSSSTQLLIQIDDVDDNHPHFASKLYRLNPSENLKAGSSIAVFSVLDKDLAVGNVVYEIYKGNDADFFDLNNMTGVMSLKKELDREMTSKFSLQIRAYSLASQNKVERKRRSIDFSSAPFDQATVLINVQDINDNSPIFTKTNFIAAVREDAKFNSFIIQIYANDSDTGSYGSLVYQITSGNEEQLVKIEKQSGYIRVYKSLVGDSGKTITLSVTANDNNGLALSNKAINNAVVRIYIIGDEQTGIVTMGTSADYLHDNIVVITRLLSNATMATVTIDKIVPTVNKNAFLIYFHAVDEVRQRILTKNEISKLIAEPVSNTVNSGMLKRNITLYYEDKPVAGKSISTPKNNNEIYIGIIAAMTILLLCMAMYATWAACFKANGFSMVPRKDPEAKATRFKPRRCRKRKEMAITEEETRTNTMETAPYANDTIKSARNRYIIEPYESNENIEVDDDVIERETASNLNSSPYYTVEPHEEITMETQPTSYLNYAAKQSLPTWAYGESVSLNSQDDMDEIVEEKLSNFSDIQINRINEMPACNDTFISKESLTTGGPLFTSERVDDIPLPQGNQKEESRDVQTSQTDDSHDERMSPTEESCDIDGTITCVSSDDDITKETCDTSRDIALDESFGYETSSTPLPLTPVPRVTPTSPLTPISPLHASPLRTPFRFDSRPLESSTPDMTGTTLGRDVNRNDISRNDIRNDMNRTDANKQYVSKDGCRSEPLKTIKDLEIDEENDMVTHL